MEQVLIYTFLVIFGLALGSFAGAQVWRLRARQLVEDKAVGEKVDKHELKQLEPLTKATLKTDRSRCLHCGHTLAWYDLLPLASWLSTGGKCRYCKKKIGWFEPLMEIGMAVFFVVSYVFWPEMLTSALPITHFVLWLVAGVFLVMLFVYDMKWFLLPNKLVFPLIGIGLVVAVLQMAALNWTAGALVSLVVGVVILSGLYLILWLASKGKWIGFGDVKLGLALALLLADWQLAFLALFAANVIGCVLVIPGMLAGKISRKTHVPFGPLLILGAFVAMLWGYSIIGWYFTAFV